MKFTFSFLDISLAIGHLFAVAPGPDVRDTAVATTGQFAILWYWSKPDYQGPSNIIRTVHNECVNVGKLDIKSATISEGDKFALYTSGDCTGKYFTAAGLTPSLPAPFSGNVNSYICKTLE